MPLEFRPSQQSDIYHLYDGCDHIGVLEYHAPEYEDDVEFWAIEIWSLTDTKTWSTDGAESHEQAFQWTRELYEEYVLYRDAPSGPSVNAISMPMGGQRRRR